MDVDAFEPALHALFDEFPISPQPNGRRFSRILDEVPALACENNLALLNLAASMLEPGESFVEVGSYQGASLIGAMVGNDDGDFVAIDNFAMSGSSRKALEENIARFALDQPTIIEGDAFQVVPSGALAGKTVAVYLEQQPRARLLVWIPGKDNGYAAWWEGVKVLAWESDAGVVLTPAEAEAVVQLGADPV